MRESSRPATHPLACRNVSPRTLLTPNIPCSSPLHKPIRMVRRGFKLMSEYADCFHGRSDACPIVRRPRARVPGIHVSADHDHFIAFSYREFPRRCCKPSDLCQSNCVAKFIFISHFLAGSGSCAQADCTVLRPERFAEGSSAHLCHRDERGP